MAARLERDPVTGDWSAHLVHAGKPGPTPTRSHRQPASCVFCQMSQSLSDGARTVDEGEREREPLAVDPECFAVANAYPVLTDEKSDRALPGQCELIVSSRHVEDICELEEEEFSAMVRMAEERTHALARTWPYVAAFINVGIEAGGSVSHLHIQVVAAQIPARGGEEVADALRACRQRAQDLGMALDARSWVPVSGIASWEVRVSELEHEGNDWTELARAAWQVTRAWQRDGKRWPYNMLLHPGPQPWIQLVPRTDAGIAYRELFGFALVIGDQQAYAQRMRELLDLET